jgi:hypothetical protein
LSNLFDELRIQQVEFTVRVSFLELYNEELFDLLSPTDDSSKIRYDHASEVICILYLPEYKTTLYIRQPPFTIFNFQENINIHVSQVFEPLIVRILNILELNSRLS